MITFHNTLGDKKEEFKPINPPTVSMYNCGPTVYDYVHIGNLRSFVLADTIRKTLEYNNYKVNQVINITDIGLLSGDGDTGEDKMMLGLKRENKPFTLEAMKELADFYTQKFLENISELNINKPEHLVRATEHINEQIELIKTLEEKGFAYKTEDGLYFDTEKFPKYGELGNINIEGLREGARIGKHTDKKSPTDFALWKLNPNFGFESPWGKGSPGWHIECSAMSMKYLGESFDIHTGGIDLIPTHHNNEIAQSESVTEKPFVHYWLHNAFVNSGEEKMAKSAGNFLTLETLKERGFNPLSYRYWLLTAHYRTPVTYSDEAIKASQKAFENILHNVPQTEVGTPDKDYLEKFKNYINDDLDTPKAVALLNELVADSKIEDKDKLATIIDFDKVLGLNILELSKSLRNIPEEIQKLATEREQFRKEENWPKSDELRNQIEKAGFVVNDSKDKTEILKKLTA